MRTGALEEFASWCLSGIVLVPEQLVCPSARRHGELATANGFYAFASAREASSRRARRAYGQIRRA